jgi:hypothetical protein
VNLTKENFVADATIKRGNLDSDIGRKTVKILETGEVTYSYFILSVFSF